MSEQNLNKTIIEFAKQKLDKLYKFNENYPTNKNITKFMEIMDLLSGDIEFTCGTQKFADRIAKMPGTDVYNYVFFTKRDPSKHEYIPPMPPRWPKYDVISRKYMEIGLDFKVRQHHRTEFCKFWNEELPSLVRKKMKEERREPRDLCPSLEPYFNEHRKL
ncbi:unnamed protein product [Dibothriocephalus latus]|uniref:Uncharacterized protein n=1 Tax=Dibothriocephalus latus TaxID=60516 RepID=A0A3P7NN54_DIBLA|nr:unnamed protein product [Dibothriocephalus latus]